jgi:hypothetical protein
VQLVVAQTEGGAVCGGYNPRGWIGLGEDRDAIAAFLFTWPHGDTAQRPIKLPKVGGPGLAVVGDRLGGGVQFGAEGLTVTLGRGTERLAKCRYGCDARCVAPWQRAAAAATRQCSSPAGAPAQEERMRAVLAGWAPTMPSFPAASGPCSRLGSRARAPS